MLTDQTAPQYRVWGTDNIAYGPFELPELVKWIKQRRVTERSYVYVEEARKWVPAPQVAELKMFFDKQAAAGPTAETGQQPAPVKPENLRRIKIFADMDTGQLTSVLTYLQVLRINKFAPLFRKGDRGDAMYSILEGELRAALTEGGKETTLFTLSAGDSFGEIALLIQSPRTSDILANEDSVLLKLPASAFERITREAPALATPFLLAIARMISMRALDLGKKFDQAMRSGHTLSGDA